jgi:hypothetical protein
VTAITAEDRYEIVIQAALDYMAHQDWYGCEDLDDDTAVLADLDRLYAENPDLRPTPCSGSLFCDTGVTLALVWEAEQRAAYERSVPIWACDCGTRYKREQWGHGNECFYTVTPDGLFDEPAGTLRGKRGIGSSARDPKYYANNGGCITCHTAFKATVDRQADPQTSLLFDLL